MGRFRKAGAWLGLVEDEDDGGFYVDELAAGQVEGEARPAEIDSDIATIYPITFQDARTVGSYFREDVPVILNLSGLSEAEAKRFVDFASGLIIGRLGNLERISHRVFLLLPRNVAMLSADDVDAASDGFYNQG